MRKRVRTGLIPYPVINHYSGYIADMSVRKFYDQNGNVYFTVDEDIRRKLKTKLNIALLIFCLT